MYFIRSALPAVAWAAVVVTWGAATAETRQEWERRETEVRLSSGLQIVAVSVPSAWTGPGQAGEASAGILDYPRPPLAGFSPLVAITTSDEQSNDDFDFEHDLQDAYVGCPLNPGPTCPPAPAVTQDYIIGILDSGSVVDLVAGPSAAVIGLTGSHLTGNEFPIGGVGGTLNADLSYPVGFFAQGLSAVNANGELDLNQVIGHSNVSIVVAPDISCSNGESLTAVAGTALMSFFASVVRVDSPQRVMVGGRTITSPDVRLLDLLDPSIPVYPRSISIEFGGYMPVTTASYYPDFEDLETPMFPTLLSMTPLSIPLGGAFFATVGLLQGEPGPLNPIQTMRALVDTGAQSSIMSQGMAANLNLDLLNPDFMVDVCGLGGLVEDVPGFYVDYVKMNASGGALEFSRAPFVVLDLDSPEGGVLEGVLGMNFFWNRNIVFDPSFTASSFLHVSNPIPLAYGDFDRDFDVDQDDLDFFLSCMSGPAVAIGDPNCTQVDADGDGDTDLSDFGRMQVCLSGTDVRADPNCGR